MRPDRLLTLLIIFAPLSLTTIGGGQSAISEYHRQMVSQQGWMTEQLFVYDFAHVAPGAGAGLAAGHADRLAGGGLGRRAGRLDRHLPAVVAAAVRACADLGALSRPALAAGDRARAGAGGGRADPRAARSPCSRRRRAAGSPGRSRSPRPWCSCTRASRPSWCSAPARSFSWRQRRRRCGVRVGVNSTGCRHRGHQEARDLPRQARLHPDARALRRDGAGGRPAPAVRDPEARRDPAALRPAARAGRRVQVLGGDQGARRSTRTTSGWPSRSRTIRSTTAISRAPSRRASMAAARSCCGIAATGRRRA